MDNKLRLLIIGHGRHGKDTMAEILNFHFGFSYISSSQFCCEEFIYERLKNVYDYKTIGECFDDRFNHRDEWFHMICEYNKDDKARLGKDIITKYDIFVGLRDKEELEECKRQNVFNLIVWVDGSKRLPNESSSSFNIGSGEADIIIENNGTYEEFENKVLRFGRLLWNSTPHL